MDLWVLRPGDGGEDEGLLWGMKFFRIVTGGMSDCIHLSKLIQLYSKSKRRCNGNYISINSTLK